MGEAAKGVAPERRAAAIAARAALVSACFGLGGCSVPRALNPVEIYREVSGANDATRPTPPGLDRPFPSLATVPPRPDRPTPEAREAITAALAEDRSRSRDPLVLRTAPGAAGGTTAGPGLSGGPPPRPSLAAAPRIPWTEAPSPPAASPPGARGPGAPSPAASPSPGTPPPPRSPTARPGTAAPDVPDAPPLPPAPDLLGAPPPPPSPDLSAPPPPARR